MKKSICAASLFVAVSSFAQLSDSQIKNSAEAQFKKYVPQILASHGSGDEAVQLDVMETKVGDFTGDGKKDAVVFYSLALKNGGNAHVGRGAAFYKNYGRSIKVFAGMEPEELFTIEKISGGKIYAKTYNYAAEDGLLLSVYHFR